jgi:hypothetical protein
MGELREGLPEAGKEENRGNNREAQTLKNQLIDRIESRLGLEQRGYIHVPWGRMLEIVTDECIRQMEWVRSEQYESWSGACEADCEPCCWRDIELTIAPDDWKP